MSIAVLLLLVAASAVDAPLTDSQKPGGNPARISACTVLTRDIVAKVTTDKAVLGATPQESPVGRYFRNAAASAAEVNGEP